MWKVGPRTVRGDQRRRRAARPRSEAGLPDGQRRGGGLARQDQCPGAWRRLGALHAQLMRQGQRCWRPRRNGIRCSGVAGAAGAGAGGAAAAGCRRCRCRAYGRGCCSCCRALLLTLPEPNRRNIMATLSCCRRFSTSAMPAVLPLRLPPGCSKMEAFAAAKASKLVIRVDQISAIWRRAACGVPRACRG